MTDDKAPLAFEEALSELESLVDILEKGDLSLEQSLQSYERGMQLTHSCQDALKNAEQKVRILSNPTDDADLEPYDSEH
jgi:exodeoxyribonuclease VII small subunit